MRATLLGDPGDVVEVVDCNCSICTKKGYLHAMVEEKDFHLLQGKDCLSTYTFGTHTAQHWFCSKCGIHSFYKPRSHPHGISVNVHCLDDWGGSGVLSPSTLTIIPLDGRNWEKNASKLKPLPP